MPIPVVKATKALPEVTEAGILEVRADNETAIQNLTRLADSKGFKLKSEKLPHNVYISRGERHKYSHMPNGTSE